MLGEKVGSNTLPTQFQWSPLDESLLLFTMTMPSDDQSDHEDVPDLISDDDSSREGDQSERQSGSPGRNGHEQPRIFSICVDSAPNTIVDHTYQSWMSRRREDLEDYRRRCEDLEDDRRHARAPSAALYPFVSFYSMNPKTTKLPRLTDYLYL